MIDSQRIAEVIGAPQVLGSTLRSLSALESLVRSELPKMALKPVVERAPSGAQQRRRLLHTIVPEATCKRRAVLCPEASERTERLARVVATAEFAWDDRQLARRLLHEPHPMLEGRSPVSVPATDIRAG